MSNRNDLEKLLNKHERRLQKLKEKEAIFGLNVQPEILIEIEDIQGKIKKLRSELADLESLDKSNFSSLDTPPQTSQEPNSSNDSLSYRNILAGIIITVVGGIILAFIIREGVLAPTPTPTATDTPTKIIVKISDTPTATHTPTFIPTPTPTPLPTNTKTPTPKPMPRVITDKVSFYDSLEEYKVFPVGDNADGRSWYDGGYNVLSLDSKSTWMWIMPGISFAESVIEVDVTPMTYGGVTGYEVITGWEPGNNYYAFIVRPNGSCDFVSAEAHAFLDYARTPRDDFVPVQNKTVHVRLEIDNDKSNSKIFRIFAFIDGKYVFEKTMPRYKSGLIGLGVYNGGEKGSGVKAQVRFNNLTIWDISGK